MGAVEVVLVVEIFLHQRLRLRHLLRLLLKDLLPKVLLILLTWRWRRICSHLRFQQKPLRKGLQRPK
jgi:hypothetical protein